MSVDLSFLEESVTQDEANDFKYAANHHGLDAKMKSDTTIMHVIKRAAKAQERGDLTRHNYWMQLAYQKLVNFGAK